MTRIESEKVIINKPASEVFAWFSDLNNFRQLMPGQVEDWVSTENDCSFTIKGMASLGMEITEKIPVTLIKLSKKGKAPFEFVLYFQIGDQGNGTSSLCFAFDAELNPVLKMMAEKPLTNFLNMLVKKYQSITTA
jgi:carbon monoxide dehydrogenase subunit G